MSKIRWNHKLVVDAIERYEPLRLHLWELYPKHMRAANTWREVSGSNCGRYRGLIRMIFDQELERDPNGFKNLLREADLNL